MSTEDERVIVVQNGATITLPTEPLLGYPVNIIADGGTCTVNGPIQGGPQTLPQGSIGIFSYSSTSGEWSVVTGSGGIPIPGGAVPNIAALRKIIGTANSQISLGGYYVPTDGGGGTFNWDTTSSTGDNGGTIIVPTGSTSGRWLRIFQAGLVDVRWFGAYGDNTHDDTAALQEAMNQTGTVVFAEGTYKTTAPLNLPHNTTLQGVNQNLSGINAAHNGNGIQILDPINSSTADFSYIRDLFVTGPGEVSTGIGVYQQGGTYFGIQQCQVVNFKTGISFYQTEVSYIRDCVIELCTFAEVHLSGADGYLNNIEVDGCDFGGPWSCGICIEGGYTLNIHDNNFTGHGRPGYPLWQASTNYAVGAIVTSGIYGLYYTAIVSGTSGGGSGPNFTSGTGTDGGVTWEVGNGTGTNFSGICSIYTVGMLQLNIGPNYFEESKQCAAVLCGVLTYDSVLNGGSSSVGTNVNICVIGNYLDAGSPFLSWGGEPFFDSAGPETLTLLYNTFAGSSGGPGVIGLSGIQTLDAVGNQNTTSGALFDQNNTDRFSAFTHGNINYDGAGAGVGLNIANPVVEIDTQGRTSQRFIGWTLVNGTNNNAVLPLITSANVSGPTGAFEITGIVPAVDGQLLLISNQTGQTMTLGHQNAGSTAANRLVSSTGADLVLATAAGGFSWARLIYSGAISRWLILGHS